MLHSAAMPISGLEHNTSAHVSQMETPHTPEQHAAMMKGEANQDEVYCPESSHPCCMVTALTTQTLTTLKVHTSGEAFSALPISPAIQRPNFIYKPPKIASA